MPLAARALEITVSDAPDLSGRVGAALMAIEEFLDEDAVHHGPGAVAAVAAAGASAAAADPRDGPGRGAPRTVGLLRFGNRRRGGLDLVVTPTYVPAATD